MNTLQRAVTRLHDQFPLQDRQAALPADIAQTHRSILRSFAERGRPPSIHDLATVGDPTAAIARLASDDLIVVHHDRITGAYPFTLEDTPHRLVMDGHTVNAMCSLDAVAVAPVFGIDVVIESTCAITGTPIDIHQTGDVVHASQPSDVRVGIRWQQPTGCAAHSMCRDMVFLADARTAEAWRGDDPDAAGVFDIHDAIEFGVRFFGPLVDDRQGVTGDR